MTIRTMSGSLVLLLLGVQAGCGGDDSPAKSAAIDTLESGRIVVRNAPDPEPASPIHLERRVRIGSVDDHGPSPFGRVADVTIGPDSLVYVLDGMAAEVRVFSLEGHYLRTIGGRGDGPGELRAPYAISFDSGGRLWVVDERHRRYTLYDRAGTPLKTLRRPIRWPITTGELMISSMGLIQEYGWWGSGPGGAVRMSVSGDVVSVLDTVPIPPLSRPLFIRPHGEPIGMAVPFAARQSAAVGVSGSVWTGHGSTYRIAELTSSGDTARLVELEVEPARLSVTEDAAAQDTVELARGRGLEVDTDLLPASHPFFTGITVADNGDVWVRRPSERAPPTSSGGTGSVFDVFDAAGRYLGTLPAPIASRPGPHISNGLLVGVARDELGVDHVEVYAVRPWS